MERERNNVTVCVVLCAAQCAAQMLTAATVVPRAKTELGRVSVAAQNARVCIFGQFGAVMRSHCPFDGRIKRGV